MCSPTIVQMLHCSSRSERLLVILISIVNTYLDKCSTHQGLTSPRAVDGTDGLQIWIVAANVLSGAAERERVGGGGFSSA